MKWNGFTGKLMIVVIPYLLAMIIGGLYVKFTVAENSKDIKAVSNHAKKNNETIQHNSEQVAVLKTDVKYIKSSVNRIETAQTMQQNDIKQILREMRKRNDD